MNEMLRPACWDARLDGGLCSRRSTINGRLGRVNKASVVRFVKVGHSWCRSIQRLNNASVLLSG